MSVYVNSAANDNLCCRILEKVGENNKQTHRYLRRILGISWQDPISYEKVMSRTKLSRTFMTSNRKDDGILLAISCAYHAYGQYLLL